ncbi:sensor histidine kinase [Niallia sp. 01092]|uniref:sensor histidine kinase n=1 Tax=unclassified Niallia TaxID=2837522 RepID=UPI003FCFD8FA
MRIKEIGKKILGIAIVITVLFLCWSAAFHMTSWFFGRVTITLSLYTKQIINSFLGFFLFGCIMVIMSFVAHKKGGREKFFIPLIKAMDKMAQGKFNIDLSSYKDLAQSKNHVLYQVVKSIENTAEKLGEMEQLRQEFISNVSHEIQSPLTSIRGFANALQNNEISAEDRFHYLQIIETESVRLSKLSDNLLKLTSLESENPPFEPKAYRLDQQLRRVVLSCEPLWTEKNLEMDISLKQMTIQADEELMDQVWVNIIHNSIKFTPMAGEITILLNEKDGKIAVTIKDTGIGIPEDVQMHIFERFYKVDPSRNRGNGGSGLGLSIVQKIIDLHHGEIKLVSQPQKGTEMTIILPEKLMSANKDRNLQGN